MDEAEQTSLVEKFAQVFKRASKTPAELAREEVAAIIKTHGADALQEALGIAKADAATDPPADPTAADLELTAEEMAALGVQPIAKADSEPETESRLKALEAAVKALQDEDASDETEEPMAKQTADPLADERMELVKQGVPPVLIENSKDLLGHADQGVKDAAKAMLLKQADPALVAVFAKETGSAAIPTDPPEETTKQGLLDILAKADGDLPVVNGTVDPKALLALLNAAGGN